MTEPLADSVAKIQNVRQLGAVVTAMRGIAASRAQKARTLLAGIDAYSAVISRGIGEALKLLPVDATPTRTANGANSVAILFCAEQGFAGAFSERVLHAAAGNVGSSEIMLVGTRGKAVAAERGIKVAWFSAAASHVDAVPGFASHVADALYARIASGALARVDVFYSLCSRGAKIEVECHSLLPIDFGRMDRPTGGAAPLITLAPQRLLESLVVEYVYAQLCAAAMHSFEAENQARLVAMASAKTNIESKTRALVQRERQLRQESITTEIIELADNPDVSNNHGLF
jgi:F-type H+-transporting ATPase subunit gamma